MPLSPTPVAGRRVDLPWRLVSLSLFSVTIFLFFFHNALNPMLQVLSCHGIGVIQMSTSLFLNISLAFFRSFFFAIMWHLVMWYPNAGPCSARTSWSRCGTFSFPTAFSSSAYPFWTISVFCSKFTSGKRAIPYIAIARGSL